MSEHLTDRQIECYYNRLMTPAELLVAMDHVSQCDACREQFKPELRIRAASEALRSDLKAPAQYYNHLTYEESAGYIDECLGAPERETVESHLDLCAACATGIADLRAFRAEMTMYPDEDRLPSSATQKPSFWRSFAFRIPVQLAAAASVVVLCALIAIVLLRKDDADLKTQVSELHEQSETPQPQPPAAEELQPQAPDAQQPPEPNGSTQPLYEIHDGGGVVSIDNQGKVTGLEAFPSSYQQAVKAGLTNKRMDIPSDLKGLIGKQGTLLGTGQGIAFGLIGPIATVVKNDRPTFRWRPLSGATGYVVTVYDPDFNKVTSSPQQSGTAWTPPQPLNRGDIYSWQVKAILEGREILSPAPPAPDAKFKILESSKAKELERAKQSYPDSHLVMGILYQQAGLFDDAEREFRTLYRANQKSQIVRKLLRDVQSFRGAIKSGT